jgi:hypothetical protein
MAFNRYQTLDVVGRGGIDARSLHRQRHPLDLLTPFDSAAAVLIRGVVLVGRGRDAPSNNWSNP